LEVMTQNIILAAFERVTTVEGGVELLGIFYSLAKRDVIKRTLEKKVSDIYQIFFAELNWIKIEFETQRKAPAILRTQPDYSGSAHWAKALLRRGQGAMQALLNATYSATPSLVSEAKSQYEALVCTLEEYIAKLHADWVSTLRNNLYESLSKVLMSHRPGELLKMEFDRDLYRVFGEISCFQKLKCDSPFHIQDLYLRKEELRVLRENVLLVVRDYNCIIQTLQSNDIQLFREKIKFLDRKLKPGLTSLTWYLKMI
jgi:dynein heavy chain